MPAPVDMGLNPDSKG